MDQLSIFLVKTKKFEYFHQQIYEYWNRNRSSKYKNIIFYISVDVL